MENLLGKQNVALEVFMKLKRLLPSMFTELHRKLNQFESGLTWNIPADSLVTTEFSRRVTAAALSNLLSNYLHMRYRAAEMGATAFTCVKKHCYCDHKAYLENEHRLWLSSPVQITLPNFLPEAYHLKKKTTFEIICDYKCQRNCKLTRVGYM